MIYVNSVLEASSLEAMKKKKRLQKAETAGERWKIFNCSSGEPLTILVNSFGNAIDIEYSLW